MTTLREHLHILNGLTVCAFGGSKAKPCGCRICDIRRHHQSMLTELDESESAWRKDGSTYRLVPDKIEVNS